MSKLLPLVPVKVTLESGSLWIEGKDPKMTSPLIRMGPKSMTSVLITQERRTGHPNGQDSQVKKR